MTVHKINGIVIFFAYKHKLGMVIEPGRVSNFRCGATLNLPLPYLVVIRVMYALMRSTCIQNDFFFLHHPIVLSQLPKSLCHPYTVLHTYTTIDLIIHSISFVSFP